MNELRKYCLPSPVRTVFCCIGVVIFFIGMYLFGFLMLCNMNLAEKPTDKGALILAGFQILILLRLYKICIVDPKRRFNNKIAYLKRNNLMDLVLNDFSQGVKMCSDCVIFGYNCIIAKDNGYIFFYNEIEKAYIDTVTTTDTNDDTTTTDYFSVVVGRKKHHICEFSGRRNEWNEIKTFLALKNPNIQVR